MNYSFVSSDNNNNNNDNNDNNNDNNNNNDRVLRLIRKIFIRKTIIGQKDLYQLLNKLDLEPVFLCK